MTKFVLYGSIQLLRSLKDDRDLRASGDEGQVLVRDLVEDVAAAERVLDRRALEVGEVLAGEAEDRGRLLAGDGTVICS